MTSPYRHVIDLRRKKPSRPAADEPRRPLPAERRQRRERKPEPPPRSEPVAPPQSDVAFADLGLCPPLMRAVSEAGYVAPTPIQAQAIAPLLAGRDLLGIAQTGTGKTAAFTLPLLQRLDGSGRRRQPRCARALVLTPTRELAIQIGDSLETYGRYLRQRHTVIFGGVKQGKQVQAMARGVDTLVATPGRLLDLMNQGHVELGAVEAVVLDEADRMLDMGFIHDVKRVIAALPRRRQTLLFSATMPDAVARIARHALGDHVRVEVTPEATTVEKIEHSVLFVAHSDKKQALADIFRDPAVSRAIVFSRTKHGANRISEYLNKVGVAAQPLHGNRSQSARQRALAAFQGGRCRALVATDIAARGIDVDRVTHVINFDLPNEPESYVHRIGRTARAGHEGVAISFCSADELDYLRDIQKTIRETVPVLSDNPWRSDDIQRDFDRGVRGRVVQRGRQQQRSQPRSGDARRSGRSGSRGRGGRRRG